MNAGELHEFGWQPFFDQQVANVDSNHTIAQVALIRAARSCFSQPRASSRHLPRSSNRSPVRLQIATLPPTWPSAIGFCSTAPTIARCVAWIVRPYSVGKRPAKP